jgi:hypothetical protein
MQSCRRLHLARACCNDLNPNVFTKGADQGRQLAQVVLGEGRA